MHKRKATPSPTRTNKKAFRSIEYLDDTTSTSHINEVIYIIFILIIIFIFYYFILT